MSEQSIANEALTPVDWSATRVQCYESWDDTKSGVAEIVTEYGQFLLTSHQHPVIAVFSAPSDRRCVAALALHGQTFGFTWADVDALEECGSAANLIADRIAALLPPRDGDS